jgi:hypothetical protein
MTPQVNPGRARACLKRATGCILLMVLSLPLLALSSRASDALYIVCGLAFLALFAACHVYLGRCASSVGQSWVYYGCAPLAWPLAGALISMMLLHSRLKATDFKA